MRLATTDVGAPGRPAGVTAFDAGEVGLLPTAFRAVTLNVYDVPFVNPVIVVPAVPTVLVAPPGEVVTV